MNRIKIADLEVTYRVGVTEEERAKPQRLLLTVEMTLDLTSASISDRIEKTINYKDVADRLLRYGDDRSWKLIEKLAANIADLILSEYKPAAVLVEVKKFVIPKASYVSVTFSRSRRV